MGAEQRIAPRRATHSRIWVNDAFVRRYARLLNISVGGARIAAASPPPVGTLLELRFFLACDDREIVADGVVVWRSDGFRGRGGLLGVEFNQVTPGEVIARFVST